MKPLLLAVALSLRALAAPDDWQALCRLVAAQETMVQTIDGKRHTGAFVSHTDASIVIQTQKGLESFERPRVRLITARFTPRAHSARKGAIIAGSIGLLFVKNLDDDGAGAVPTLAIFGALIGVCNNTMTPVYRNK